MDTYIYLLIWLFIFFIGTLLLAHTMQEKHTLKDIIFEASSAFGNVGMSSGITHAEMINNAKIILIVIMFAGRLELMPLMILLGIMFRMKEKEERTNSG